MAVEVDPSLAQKRVGLGPATRAIRLPRWEMQVQKSECQPGMILSIAT